jgi:squalene-hopene/tetraprenyl-beta-curcumene cyclase
MNIEAQSPKVSQKITDAMSTDERLALKDAMNASMTSGFSWTLADQHDDGYWVGKLESNCCMEAQWLLALHFMGLLGHPSKEGLVRALLRQQRDDGSWEIYKNAPAGDINTTVECYAALAAVGGDKNAPHMQRARDWILSKGGLKHIRVFTRYWLALIGEWPWTKTPNIPPEVIYFPKWFPFNIYNFASWARATLMPIAVLSARRQSKPLRPGQRLDELFPGGRDKFDYSLPKNVSFFSLENFFLWADRFLHRAQSLGLPPGRKAAKERVTEWIVRHQDADGVWGGIQPPWIYSLMALHAEGYPLTHPVMAKGIGALQDPRWAYERDGATFIQASTSPVWDTVLTLLAMHDCNAHEKAQNAPAIEKAIYWLLKNEVRTGGDWQQKVKGVEPGGWAFEYANASYPDVDDTAVALMVLAPYRDDPKWIAEGLPDVLDRAAKWVMAMQCRDGGWAAFDKDNDRSILTKIPFCDFGEALDPPSVDVTAHVLEGLTAVGYTQENPAMKRGVDYIKSEQEPAGSWWGRWGVNYIYGTAAALPALKAAGEDMRSPDAERAADWILSKQNGDGGWGETCGSYMDQSLAGVGDSTASQTAWALISLLSVARPSDQVAITKGLNHLIGTQKDGTWDEPEYTGTGFPGYGVGLRIDLGKKGLQEDLQQSTELSRAFMINYNLYRHYFPLMAMGRAEKYLDRISNMPTSTGDAHDPAH